MKVTKTEVTTRVQELQRWHAVLCKKFKSRRLQAEMTHYDHSHTMTKMASEMIVNGAWECTQLSLPLVSVLLIVPAAMGKEV